MSLDPRHPWVFERDDVDLLEDQIEDVFHTYTKKSPSDHQMEFQVLEEQLETESRSFAPVNIDIDDQSPLDCERHPFDTTPIKEIMRSHLHRDPLFVRARRWSNQLFRLAKQRREQEGDRGRDLFRIMVNTNFVPIKLFVAIGEHMHGDEVGMEVAEQEYALARLYLNRVQESLATVCARSISPGMFLALLQEAHNIEEEIMKKRQALKRQLGSL